MTDSAKCPLPEALLEHREWLRAIARNLVGDENDVDDVEQRTWLTVLGNRRPVRSARGWLGFVVRSAAADEHRSASRRRSREKAVARPEALPPTDHLVMQMEAQRAVAQAVSGLPEPYRTTVLLRYIDELTIGEVAERMSVPVPTVKTRLHRALALLRDALDREFGDRRAWSAVLLPLTATRLPVPAGAVAGGIVMKKLIAACVALVLLALGGWGFVRWTSPAADTAQAPIVASSASSPRVRTRAVVATAEELPPPVDFESVDPDRDLAGVVVGPDGSPAAGANVHARVNGWARLTAWIRIDDDSGPSARTAADGSFRVRLDPTTTADVAVRAPGFPEQVRSGCHAGQRVTIRLASGTPLVVEVVDDAEHAVSGATVFVRRSLSYGDLLQEASARTDATGVARFAEVLPGGAGVEVAVDGVAGRFSGPHALLPAGQPVRVVLPARARIEGTVTDRASGVPIAGATVNSTYSREPGVTSDARGRYAISLWQWKSWTQLQASAPGMGTSVAKVVRPGTVDFALDRAFTVKGRAVAEDGSALGDARVVVFESPAEIRAYLPAPAVAAADGTFAVTAATPGAAHVLIVAAPGRQRVVVELAPSPPAGEPAIDVGDVVLARGRRIAGIVTDGDGRPCAGDKVTVGRPSVPGAAPSLSSSLAWNSESVSTDNLGRFRFDALAPGAWNVYLNTIDAPAIEPAAVTLPADRDVTDVHLALPGSRTLTVRVVDDLGAPIPEASVQVSGDFGQVGRATQPLFIWTGADGCVKVRGLPAVPVHPFASVTFDRPFVRIGNTPPVTPEGQELTVVLARAVLLRGKVVDDDGTPIVGDCVDARIAGRPEDTGLALTKADGSFEIMVPAGQLVDLRLRGTRQETRADGAQYSVSTDYHGALTGLRGPLDGLVLRATNKPESFDRTLTVFVVDLAGGPVAEMDLSANWGSKGARAKTDATGRAFLTKLPAEQVHVSVWDSRADRPGLQVPPAPLDVVPENQEVRAPFRQGVELRGRVVDTAGKPVRATISVRTPEYAYTRAQCDADGRFVVAALPGVPSHVEADTWVGTDRRIASRAGVVPGADEIELVVRPVAK